MQTPERRIGGFIEEAPEMVMPPSFLDQPTSWYVEPGKPVSEGRVVTIKEYIASRAPQTVRDTLGIPPSEGNPVKGADELPDDELRELTLVILRGGRDDEFLAVLGSGSYSKQEHIAEVERGTALGRQTMDGTRLNVALIQRLIDSGKLRISEEEPDGKRDVFDIDLPDFDF